MKLTQKGNRYYVVKRVPQRFAAIERRRQVWLALGTDSPREARHRAAEAVRDLENQWIATLKSPGTSIQRYEAQCEMASARGFVYAPASQVAQLSIDELLRRITVAQESPTIAQAVLGHEEKPKHRLSEIVALYIQLVAVEVKDKGRDQRRMWENALKRSVSRLIKAIGNKPIEDLQREDALAFRSSWAKRFHEEGVSASSANREIATLSGLFSTLYKLKGVGNPALFKGLAFAQKKKRRPPYDEAFIRDLILPALDKGELNQEAADICRILINTGMRPSEVTGLAPVHYSSLYTRCEVTLRFHWIGQGGQPGTSQPPWRGDMDIR